MQDLLDRAFFLHLPSAVEEVLARRHELSGEEKQCIESELIDALEMYTKRQYTGTIPMLQGLLADIGRLRSPSVTYLCVLLTRCFAGSGQPKEGLQLLEVPEISAHFVEPLAKSTYYWQLANMLRLERRFNEAREALQRALDLVLQSTVPKNAARIIADMATVHISQGDEARAITLYEQAIAEFGDDPDYSETLIRTRGNLASVYQRINRVDEALRVYEELIQLPTVKNDWIIFIAVKLNRAIALKALKRMGDSFDAYDDVRLLARDHGDFMIEIRALIGLSDLHFQLKEYFKSRSYADDALRIALVHDVHSLIAEAKRRIAALDIEEGKLDEAIEIMRSVYAQLASNGDYSDALIVAAELVEYLSREARYKEALEVNEASVKIQRSIYEAEIERSVEISTVRQRLANEREAVRVRDEERTKVLHAVMPAHIANRLTAGERQIVDTLPAVTILFADVVGFTELVSSMTGEALLELLSKLFAGLDIAASRFGCERIKTIGDSYMAICGASESVDDHIERIVRMALCVVNGEVPLPIDSSKLRIGINTGPVIAGVMDGQRISYDVWGDTVNVAARMEEHSRPGSVNCTESVAQRIMHLPEFRLIKREPLNIHGKGLMTTYWIESAF